MTFSRNKRINTTEPRLLFWSLVFGLLFCLFSYGYFVRGAIVNIVARQTMEGQLTNLSSSVLSLESEYIKVKNEVTLEKAHTLGFIAVSSQKFVERDSKNPGLSLVSDGL